MRPNKQSLKNAIVVNEESTFPANIRLDDDVLKTS